MCVLHNIIIDNNIVLSSIRAARRTLVRARGKFHFCSYMYNNIIIIFCTRIANNIIYSYRANNANREESGQCTRIAKKTILLLLCTPIAEAIIIYVRGSQRKYWAIIVQRASLQTPVNACA